jgi:hypothetical protein
MENELIDAPFAGLKLHSNEWFEAAFKQNTPEDIKRLSIRLCRSYSIKGICDPMYIANIIALELGRGDGQGNFY